MPRSAVVKTRTGITLHLEGRVPMRMYRRFVDADSEARYEDVYEVLAQVVREWDVPDLDPSDPASYDELDVEDYLSVVIAVGEWMSGRPAAKN